MLIYLSNRGLSPHLWLAPVCGEPSRGQWWEREREAVSVGREDPMLQFPLLGGSVMGKLFLPSGL